MQYLCDSVVVRKYRRSYMATDEQANKLTLGDNNNNNTKQNKAEKIVMAEKMDK